MGWVAQSAGVFQTHTPTNSGYSADPVFTFRYKLDGGKGCFIDISRASNGTSNAAATTITLPAVAANTDEQIIPIQVISGGVAQAGYIQTRMNSNVADIKLIDGSNPASSGLKAIQGNGWYETT